MLAILAIEGGVPPSDVLDEMEWEEALLLAERVQRLRTEQVKAEADRMEHFSKQMTEGFNAVIKSIGGLQKTMAQAFR